MPQKVNMIRAQLKKKIKKIAREAEISDNKDIAHILNQLCECMDDPNFYAKTVERPFKKDLTKRQ